MLRPIPIRHEDREWLAKWKANKDDRQSFGTVTGTSPFSPTGTSLDVRVSGANHQAVYASRGGYEVGDRVRVTDMRSRTVTQVDGHAPPEESPTQDQIGFDIDVQNVSSLL